MVRAGLWDRVRESGKRVVENAGKSRDERTRVKSTKTVTAVRGLDEDEGVGRETETRDFESLEWLEKFAVSEEAVDRFIQEGRLAE